MPKAEKGQVQFICPTCGAVPVSMNVGDWFPMGASETPIGPGLVPVQRRCTKGHVWDSWTALIVEAWSAIPKAKQQPKARPGDIMHKGDRSFRDLRLQIRRTSDLADYATRIILGKGSRAAEKVCADMIGPLDEFAPQNMIEARARLAVWVLTDTDWIVNHGRRSRRKP